MVFAQRSQIFYEVKNAKRHFLRSKKRKAVFLRRTTRSDIFCFFRDVGAL